MKTLYHGSNTTISQIDLSKSKKGKDFGKGFYLGDDREQALDMAIRTTRRAMQGTPTLNIYSFDDSVLSDNKDLRIKVFDDYSAEWADFVLHNRKNTSDTPAHPYDIVIGPIANDTVGVQLRRYTMGYISVEKLIEELKYKGNRAMQYFFGTERAVKLLKKITDEQ